MQLAVAAISEHWGTLEKWGLYLALASAWLAWTWGAWVKYGRPLKEWIKGIRSMWDDFIERKITAPIREMRESMKLDLRDIDEKQTARLMIEADKEETVDEILMMQRHLMEETQRQGNRQASDLRLRKEPRVWLNADGDIDFVSVGWTDLTSLTEEESKNGGWRQSVHPSDLEDVEEAWSGPDGAKTKGSRFRKTYWIVNLKAKKKQRVTCCSDPHKNSQGVVTDWLTEYHLHGDPKDYDPALENEP